VPVPDFDPGFAGMTFVVDFRPLHPSTLLGMSGILKNVSGIVGLFCATDLPSHGLRIREVVLHVNEIFPGKGNA
jgi:hypothetical protein